MCAICGIASHVPEPAAESVPSALSAPVPGRTIIGIHWSLGLSAFTLAVLVLGLLWYTVRAVATARVIVARRYA